MRKDYKIILLVVVSFLITILTSALLELPFFRSPVRYGLVVLLVLIELYFAFLIYGYLIKTK